MPSKTKPQTKPTTPPPVPNERQIVVKETPNHELRFHIVGTWTVGEIEAAGRMLIDYVKGMTISGPPIASTEETPATDG